MTDEWLLDPALAYLNHGSFGALPAVVARAAARLRQEVESNPSGVLMRRWPAEVDGVRSRVATLLGAPTETLAFVPNATTGTATVLAALDLRAGDELLTTDHAYGAVAVQLGVTAERHGARVVTVPLPTDVAGTDEVVTRVLAGVGPRTRLLVVDDIASPTGLVLPVERLVPAAHEAGVPVLVDAAHAPGQVAVDLAALQPDYWVGNLHKWVCCPRALGVLYVAAERTDRVRPLVASHHYLEGYHGAFDWTGTLDPVPVLSVPAALDYWEAYGWAAARRTQRELVDRGAAQVAEALGTRVAGDGYATAAMRIVELPVALDRAAADAFAARLDVEHGVVVAVMAHGGRSYLRMSGQLYNRPRDYERLADATLALLGLR